MAEAFHPPYEIIDKICATGGMAEVFRGINTRIGRECAIKVMRQGIDPIAPDLFHREALVLGQLNHDNIVKVVDYNHTDAGAFYIVMELLTGKDCERIQIERKWEPLEHGRIVRIMEQTLDALRHTHEKGIVHRDLKPSNVFLERFGTELERVKLLDFGIAQTQSLAMPEHTSPTARHFHTLRYASPEQLTDTEPVDHRTDIYSLGLVFYEMLAGQRVFSDGNFIQVFNKKQRPLPPLKTVRPDFPDDNPSADLTEVIARATAPDMTHRFSDAEQFQEALRRTWLFRGRQRRRSFRLGTLQPIAGPAVVSICSRIQLDSGQSGQGEFAASVFAECLAELEQVLLGCRAEVIFQRDGSLRAFLGLDCQPNEARARTARLLEALLRAHKGVEERHTAQDVHTWVTSGVHVTTLCSLPKGRITVAEPNLDIASELEKEAPLGGILASQQVRDLVAGWYAFWLQAPVVYTTSTGEATLQTYQIVQKRGRRRHESEADFVGRDEEMKTLKAVFEGLFERAEPVIAVIRGEEGLGRSRLLRNFIQYLAEGVEKSCYYLRGRGRDYMTSRAFATLAEMLRERAELPADGTGAEQRGKLRDHLVTRFQSLTTPEALDEIEEGLAMACDLACEAGDVDPNATEIIARSPWCRRERIKRDFARYLELASQTMPVVIAVEDLQLVDDASLSVLFSSMEELHQSPILLVAHTHPGFCIEEARTLMELEALHEPDVVYKILDHLAERRSVLWIDLSAMSPSESLQLAANELGTGPDRVPDVVKRCVETHSALRPIYVIELVRYLRQSGLLEISEGDPKRREAAHVDPAEVPPTVDLLIKTRLAMLEPMHRKLLAYASVVGYWFWPTVLQVIARGAGLSVSDDFFDRMKDEGVIVEERSAWFPGIREFRFRDRTLCRVANAQLSPEERQAAHRDAAGWFAEQNGMPEPTAQHYEQSGDNVLAAQFYSTASERAWKSDSPNEELAHLERAIELSPSGETPATLISLHKRIEKVLGRLGLRDRQREAIDRLRQLAQGDGPWSDLPAEIALRSGNLARMCGQYDQAERYFREAQQYFQVNKCLSEACYTMICSALSFAERAQYTTALNQAGEAIQQILPEASIDEKIAEDAFRPSLTSAPSKHRKGASRHTRPFSLVEAWKPRPQLLALAKLAEAYSLFKLGRLGRALLALGEARAAAEASGNEEHLIMANVLHAEILLEVGRPAEALARLSDFHRLHSDLSNRILRCDVRRMLARCRVCQAMCTEDGTYLQGGLEQALELLDRSLADSQQAATLQRELLGHLERAKVLLLMDGTEHQMECLQEATRAEEIAKSMDVYSHRALARALQAKLYSRIGHKARSNLLFERAVIDIGHVDAFSLDALEVLALRAVAHLDEGVGPADSHAVEECQYAVGRVLEEIYDPGWRQDFVQRNSSIKRVMEGS